MKKNSAGLWISLLTIAALCSAGIGRADEKQIQRIDVKALNRMMENHETFVLIDVASHLECMDSRIPGSLCLACDEAKGEMDLSGGRKDARLVFYGGSVPVDPDCPAIKEAIRQGYTRIYTLRGGLPAWKRAGYDAESVQRIPRSASLTLKPKDLEAWIKQNPKALVLDVRPQAAYKKNHLEGVLNIPMAVLHLRYQDIPVDRALVVIDDDGSVGFLAASYLARKGFTNTRRLVGGMAAWNAFKQGTSK